MADKKIVGYKRFKSKKGQDLCIATVVSPYSQRDLDRGCVGSRSEDVFLPDSLVNMLEPKHIDKNVEISYDIVGGRVYVSDFKVL